MDLGIVRTDPGEASLLDKGMVRRKPSPLGNLILTTREIAYVWFQEQQLSG